MTHDHPEALEYAAAAPELERVAAAVVAPVAGVYVAVTHFCQPRAPHRCWRFSKGAAAFPKWVSEYLIVQGDGTVEFQYPDNGANHVLDEGDWVVLFDKSVDAVVLYSGEEFASLFATVRP